MCGGRIDCPFARISATFCRPRQSGSNTVDMGAHRRNAFHRCSCRSNIHDAPQSAKSLFPINWCMSLTNLSDLDMRITSFEVGRCNGVLKRRQSSDGPFGSTHGVALTLFAETLAGLAVFSRLGPKGKGILLKSETEYIKKAKDMGIL